VETRANTTQTWRFGVFEVDARTLELRRGGTPVKLREQSFNILVFLLEHAGELVTREDLRRVLWPSDTFVDFDHSLNTAVMKLREALGDSADTPLYIETIPKRGYRFIAPVEAIGNGLVTSENGASGPPPIDPPVPDVLPPSKKRSVGILVVVCGVCLLLAAAGWFVYRILRSNAPALPVQRALFRLTFDEGLQTGATWSPDGRYIAYSSDRGGNFDIWVQQVSGGDPVQITNGPGTKWQADWSPDGKYIAYRSESDGGIYITPALGGAGQQRRIASFGYFPRWSPDGTRVLFQTSRLDVSNNAFVVALDGSPPRLVLSGSWTRPLAFCAWHPDGKRITAWIPTDDPVGPRFLTLPVEGGTPVESKLAPELEKQLDVVNENRAFPEWRLDFAFAWAPSGKAIYFERTLLGAKNIWRMTVDPATLQPLSVDRLTTAPALDEDLSVSPDGRRLAFTNRSPQDRAWMLPFDAARGLVTGPGQPVTSARIETFMVDVTRDGETLGIGGRQGGLGQALEVPIKAGREKIMMPPDSYRRGHPIWSPDGKRAAYMRGTADKEQVTVWSRENRNEETVGPWGSSSSTGPVVYDWSPDGTSVVVSQGNDKTGRAEIWQVPVSSSDRTQLTPRKILSDPNYDLWQPHFSRDGRWIVFEATRKLPERAESTLYVVPVRGGPWVPITDGKQWDDKPRWSPDGKAIYFLSDRAGFYNIWGIRFDPATGRPLGEPFRVTSYDSPSLRMTGRGTPITEFSLTENRLFLPLEQSSGNIWILDNVDR
jgi:Tol biopolymer transport system component/DNA-binding winged helix-turn-helix (wHTH) protein